MEFVLLICAFLTFLAVGAACFVAVIAALIVYAWQRQLQIKLAEAPGEIQKALSAVVQKYLDAQENLDLERTKYGGPVSANEDEESWSRMRGYS